MEKCESNGYPKKFFNKVLTKYKNKTEEKKIIKGSIHYIHELSPRVLKILNKNINLVHSVSRPLMTIFNKTKVQKFDKM